MRLVHSNQAALIENVFGYTNKREFIDKEKEATEVSTWDGRYRGFIPYKHLRDMVKWINILGPLAGMYGRDIEQYLMRPDGSPLISEYRFNESVNGMSHTIHRNALTTYQYQDQSATSN